jgi:hypothetical protein
MMSTRRQRALPRLCRWPGGVAALLSRHSPLATVLNDFYHDLQSESRKTPYPLEEIRQVAGRHALPLE